MELLLIELVLWAGLVFFFWALKDGLGRVESEIESVGLLSAKARSAETPGRSGFAEADELSESIGTYRDVSIHRFARIDGRRYQFDRICSDPENSRFAEDERCLRPGLVYCEYRDNA